MKSADADRKKILIVMNPKAGKSLGRPSPEKISALFPEKEYEKNLCLTSFAGQCSELVKKYAPDADFIVCCGGDGTLNETVEGLTSAGLDIPVGYIPMGSTNDLAGTLGIPTGPRGAVDVIKSGNVNEYDTGLFNGRSFSYVACFGPGTAVSYGTPRVMKNVLGYGAYMINGFVFNCIPTMLDMKPRHIKIEYDGNVLEDDFYFGAVSNSVSVAGMFRYDRRDVRLNDGRFELLLVRRMSHPAEMFSMFSKIVRRDYDGDRLMYLKASHIHMEFASPEKWSVDGEYGGAPTEVDIDVKQRSLKIFSTSSVLFT